MRQAGRYLPEYMEFSRKLSFFEMCNDPEVASEITLQPIRRFPSLDAAIIFSDILVVPKALGCSIDILKNVGPVIRKISSVTELNFSNFSEIIRPTLDALKLTKEKLVQEGYDKTLIGFAGAPWTIAAYIIEGKWEKNFLVTKKFFYQRRGEFGRIIDIITTATIEYLQKQIEYGADVIQIFDSFAGALPSHEFEKWIIEPTKRIVDAVKAKFRAQGQTNGAIIGFPKGAGTNYVRYAQETGVDVIGTDYSLSPIWVKENLENIAVIQGNLDPFLLAFNKDLAVLQTKEIITKLKEKPFIFNLGHGIFKETPIENVEAVLATIEKFRSF